MQQPISGFCIPFLLITYAVLTHEYLQFCEDAKIDAMYVFNCGMTCQGRNPDYFADKLIEEYYADTVQLKGKRNAHQMEYM